MSQESTENIEMENNNTENVSENQGINAPEQTIEEQLQEELAKEKDKFYDFLLNLKIIKTHN